MTMVLTPPSTFVTSDGTALRVVESGAPSAPLTVVFVHGWTLTSSTWDRVDEGLRKEVGSAARTVRFDLRGHGGSDPAPTGTATIEQCADDLAELIADRVPSGPIVLIGHSMGGMTIMALAEQHPKLFAGRVAGVALVATAAGGLESPTLGLPAPIAEVSNRIEREFIREQLGAMHRRRASESSRWMRPGLRWLLFGKKPLRADIAASADWVAASHPSSMAGFRASLAAHRRYDALAALRKVPTVLLAGMADRLTPIAHARRIAAELPDTQFMAYSGAGHMLPLERTGEVTARIAGLVRTVASKA